VATRAVEPDDQRHRIVEPTDIAGERIVDIAAGNIFDVAKVGDLSVVRRLDLADAPQQSVDAPQRRVYAYVPRRARPPWAKPDVLVLGEDLPNYLRAEQSFHVLTESGLHDLLEAPGRENGNRGAAPIVAMPSASPNGLADVIGRLEERGVAVVPLRDVVVQRCRLAFLDDPEAEVPRLSRRRRAALRALDLTLGAIGTAVFLALLPLIAIAILVEDRGPVFYVQERLGRGGKPFSLFKFRSMRRDAEDTGPMWATMRDDRITRVGSFLRRSKVDELPQFVNVMLGQMSLVGPRPERPVFVETLRRLIPHYDVRHQIRPGLTGWGTVKVGYGNSVEAKYLTHQYDLYHLRNRSVRFDVEIMLRSVSAIMLRGERQDRFML
jgi:lipopolysaccharide/colanic/teichoic acid biosynthesis glycosyltransferase